SAFSLEAGFARPAGCVAAAAMARSIQGIDACRAAQQRSSWAFLGYWHALVQRAQLVNGAGFVASTAMLAARSVHTTRTAQLCAHGTAAVPVDTGRPSAAATAACAAMVAVALRVHAVAVTEERTIRAATLTLHAGGPYATGRAAAAAVQRVGVEVRAHAVAARLLGVAGALGTCS